MYCDLTAISASVWLLQTADLCRGAARSLHQFCISVQALLAPHQALSEVPLVTRPRRINSPAPPLLMRGRPARRGKSKLSMAAAGVRWMWRRKRGETVEAVCEYGSPRWEPPSDSPPHLAPLSDDRSGAQPSAVSASAGA
ncbi:hypothetical protein NDU88_000346 [Pleurodeles waltl]|uniref:Uncharacterized protein n=1 Tax=Pleurodeles waltl TaxID=8319 RepID=A0AAV7VX52_PLEWA|nr:hypothetical protein NDU88_000346 [Pleurodeles waltl]